MPTPGSETYRSTNPLETRDKNTYPSRKPPEVIRGPDVPVLSTLSALDPDTLPVSDPDTEVVVTGVNFKEDSVIVWNGGDEATTFIDSEHLSTLVKPSTVDVEEFPFTLPVAVRNGEIKSNEVPFTFTEGVEIENERRPRT